CAISNVSRNAITAAPRITSEGLQLLPATRDPHKRVSRSKRKMQLGNPECSYYPCCSTRKRRSPRTDCTSPDHCPATSQHSTALHRTDRILIPTVGGRIEIRTEHRHHAYS